MKQTLLFSKLLGRLQVPAFEILGVSGVVSVVSEFVEAIKMSELLHLMWCYNNCFANDLLALLFRLSGCQSHFLRANSNYGVIVITSHISVGWGKGCLLMLPCGSTAGNSWQALLAAKTYRQIVHVCMAFILYYCCGRESRKVLLANCLFKMKPSRFFFAAGRGLIGSAGKGLYYYSLEFLVRLLLKVKK